MAETSASREGNSPFFRIEDDSAAVIEMRLRWWRRRRRRRRRNEGGFVDNSVHAIGLGGQSIECLRRDCRCLTSKEFVTSDKSERRAGRVVLALRASLSWVVLHRSGGRQASRQAGGRACVRACGIVQ